ncbi:hypothetical protein E2C01_029320 [Portunus trituberculatus]|uniref:Uncharacterized protein n=1 Tax=Portunus trituberculatus TaxID=210409 RepID=A0A5B7ESK6_PORTR|nr:hypothetical protein [Portunus trituberculatus]
MHCSTRFCEIFCSEHCFEALIHFFLSHIYFHEWYVFPSLIIFFFKCFLVLRFAIYKLLKSLGLSLLLFTTSFSKFLFSSLLTLIY